jgi:hypothetical protein
MKKVQLQVALVSCPLLSHVQIRRYDKILGKGSEQQGWLS